jgi:hypothetical protein
VFIIAGTACTAELEEGCLGGNCSPPGKPNVPVNTSSSSGTGGAGGSSCETTPATGDFPCDVFAVLQNNCNSCHQSPPVNGAPFSLLTYEDTRELLFMSTKPRWQRMGEVVESSFMPLGATIADPDKQLLLDWVSSCALPADGMGCE